MSQRSTRSSAKGAPRAGATSKNSKSGPASKEDDSEHVEEVSPPKKQRRTSAQQTIAAAEAWQQEGEGAPQGDGRRSSKRTASKPVPSRTEEEDDDEEGGVLRADTGMAYETQFNAMKMLIATAEPWMFALDVEARGDCWVMAMLACAPLSTSNRDILGYAAVACRRSSVSHSAAT